MPTACRSQIRVQGWATEDTHWMYSTQVKSHPNNVTCNITLKNTSVTFSNSEAHWRILFCILIPHFKISKSFSLIVLSSNNNLSQLITPSFLITFWWYKMPLNVMIYCEQFSNLILPSRGAYWSSRVKNLVSSARVHLCLFKLDRARNLTNRAVTELSCD